MHPHDDDLLDSQLRSAFAERYDPSSVLQQEIALALLAATRNSEAKQVYWVILYAISVSGAITSLIWAIFGTSLLLISYMTFCGLVALSSVAIVAIYHTTYPKGGIRHAVLRN